MTSEEIRTGPDHTLGDWLREIALQLAMLNEHLVEADAAVFGTPAKRQTPEQLREERKRELRNQWEPGDTPDTL